jgi:nitrate reductase molybdenum cofactor assembly chaperone NarJ/NarW
MKIRQTSQPALALHAMSRLLEYPCSDCADVIDGWITRYGKDHLAAAGHLKRFVDETGARSLTEMEETYTRTFDMAPVCSPYISGHIYGDENFERGTLLSALSERYAQAGFDLHGELPDHIMLLLKFCPELDSEELTELTHYCLKKPLADMVDQLESCENVYRHVLKAALEIVQTIH